MVGIIIQARMGSTRLPGKILKKIGSKALLEHILFRLTFLRHPAIVIIATSNLTKDDIVEDFCKQNKINCFRGSERNVLERYFLCAKQWKLNHIVRLTADNPFTDIEQLDRLIDLHVERGFDYSSSFANLPIGVGTEIFTFDALKQSYELGHAPNQIEHVNEYITDNPEKFNMGVLDVEPEINRPELRLTIDTEFDYQRACYIVENSVDDFISTKEAIRLCLQFV